jgi:hypothetical protein
VGYNSAATGTFNKSITIYYDANKRKKLEQDFESVETI